jgi:hypothetical protein
MRTYEWDSQGKGPNKEIDEDGLIAKQAKGLKKLVGWVHRTSLFIDLSLTDKAIVDCGTSKFF